MDQLDMTLVDLDRYVAAYSESRKVVREQNPNDPSSGSAPIKF
jgi:hypothetical protein